MNAKIEANGRSQKQKKAFRMECAVAIDIKAKPEKIWALLTNAADYTKWNSTIESIEGAITQGEKIKLRAKVAPGRTFKLKVSALDPSTRMVWEDGMAPMFKGVRTYTLTPTERGSTEFSMVEVFSGIMLPMIAGSLPDFGPPFEQFAADLKRAAEAS